VPGSGSVYLVGGWTGTQYATAVLRFTPPATIDLIARVPEGVRSAAVARLGHTLYVAGGRTSEGLSARLYAIDVNSGTVTTLDDLPRPVEQAVLVAGRTKLYLLGGRTASGKALDSVLAVDPATGRSKPAGAMPHPLAGAAVVPAGSRTLVVDSATGTVYRVG
jgi:hypothetical protein